MHRNTFRFAVLYTFISFILSHAHPLIEPPGGGGSNDATPTLVVNTDLVPLPIHADFGTMRLNYSDSIERVRIDDAPPGYGCFFWSNVRPRSAPDSAEPDVSDAAAAASSSSSPSEASLLQDKFVSETFYSSNASSSHDFTLFDPPLVPDYLTCFSMPYLMSPDDWVSVWIESYSLPSPRGGEREEEEKKDNSSEAEESDSRKAKYSLIHVPLSTTVSDGRLGGITFNEGIIEMRRAALVHLPKYDAECIPIRGLTHEREEDLIRIDEERQLMDPVNDAVGVVCTAESQNGRVVE